MYDIVTIGSATKDIFLDISKFKKGGALSFPLGEKIELEKVLVFSGGGGVNAATTFAFQGLKTAFCGLVGQDLAGQEILDELTQNGINLELVKIKPRIATDLGLIFHAGSERTILLHHGASRFFGEKDIDWQKLGDTKWLYVAPLWGKAAKLTGKLTDFAKGNKVRIALNPSLDQLKRKNMGKTLEKIDVLILNDEEASFLLSPDMRCPTSENWTSHVQQKAFQKIAGLTKAIIVITKGKQGAAVFDGNLLYQMPAPKVKVVDATGAGDSFGSGFVAGLIEAKNYENRSRSIEEAMQLAMANAISNIRVFGANKGLLKKGESIQKVSVRKFKINF